MTKQHQWCTTLAYTHNHVMRMEKLMQNIGARGARDLERVVRVLLDGKGTGGRFALIEVVEITGPPL